VVELFLNDLGAKPVGGSLQRRDVVDGQKCVIVLAEGDLGSVELLFDEGAAVEVIGLDLRLAVPEKSSKLS
jgi:hypothetical protein